MGKYKCPSRCLALSQMSLACICVCISILVQASSSFTLRENLINSRQPGCCALEAQRQQRLQTVEVEDEKPAGIGGAEFFGGNKEKEEFYDAIAEANADKEITSVDQVYDRFGDSLAFPSPSVSKLARGLQAALNRVLYADAETTDGQVLVQYSSKLVWESCFETSGSPLSALEKALEFYNRVDVGIVSGTQLDSSRVKLHWSISVVWPIFWEPRVVLTGSSEVVFEEIETNDDETTSLVITRQVDKLDNPDLLGSISSQVSPRFWDVYHVGMTPSAEIMPRLVAKSLFPKSYSLFEIPPRLVASPTRLDSAAGREEGTASTVPNHAFSCVIKTMGPKKERFVPASPVQVEILPDGDGNLLLKWAVPMPVEMLTNSELQLPGEDPETPLELKPDFQYEFQPKRLVATIPYAGFPQDADISMVRKQLYDKVVGDGLKPKLDESGRPQFLFFQNGVKACYTPNGLGMCVYEWRADIVKPNEVGIELMQ